MTPEQDTERDKALHAAMIRYLDRCESTIEALCEASLTDPRQCGIIVHYWTPSWTTEPHPVLRMDARLSTKAAYATIEYHVDTVGGICWCGQREQV